MFSTILSWASSGWSKLIPWVVGIGSVFAALAAVKQSGVNAQKAEDVQYELKYTKKALQTTQSIANLSDVAIAAKLRKFYRD